MIITIAFNVKNHVEVMEGWPIKRDDATFFMERDGTNLKRVCISFPNVSLEHAPQFIPAGTTNDMGHLQIGAGDYVAAAIRHLMRWQTVLTGLQVVDVEYDNYEIRFRPESVAEEDSIHVNSFRYNADEGLNRSCDFEQIGRAFCSVDVSDERIESTSHFREGRLAFGAKRYIDSYNSMYLFLESRYCDGKTGNSRQKELLLSHKIVCDAVNRVVEDFPLANGESGEKFEFLSQTNDIADKIESIVLLRGKLRHHPLKSPHRWDPNRQKDYEVAARFLSAVVWSIVTKESTDDIYSPAALETFRHISMSTGFETKLHVSAYRLDPKPYLSLDMTYPTTVLSSQLCAVTLGNALEECEKGDQLADTVKIETTSGTMELFLAELGTWAYTPDRRIVKTDKMSSIRCRFEHRKRNNIETHSFDIAFLAAELSIIAAWRTLRKALNHIEDVDPTTRIMSLKFFFDGSSASILSYRVGASVQH